MYQIDKNKIFEALCDLVMHEFSAKETMSRMTKKELVLIAQFLNAERSNRGAVWMDFLKKPNTIYNWQEWNSGGGCMIWSADLIDDMSIHLTDECLVLAKIPGDMYWMLEDPDEQEKEHLVALWREDGKDIAFELCPHVGQEIADLLAKDIQAILDEI